MNKRHRTRSLSDWCIIANWLKSKRRKIYKEIAPEMRVLLEHAMNCRPQDETTLVVQLEQLKGDFLEDKVWDSCVRHLKRVRSKLNSNSNSNSFLCDLSACSHIISQIEKSIGEGNFSHQQIAFLALYFFSWNFDKDSALTSSFFDYFPTNNSSEEIASLSGAETFLEEEFETISSGVFTEATIEKNELFKEVAGSESISRKLIGIAKLHGKHQAFSATEVNELNTLIKYWFSTVENRILSDSGEDSFDFE